MRNVTVTLTRDPAVIVDETIRVGRVTITASPGNAGRVWLGDPTTQNQFLDAEEAQTFYPETLNQLFGFGSIDGQIIFLMIDD